MSKDSLEKMVYSLRVIRRIRSLLREQELVTIHGNKDDKCFKMALKAAHHAKWKVKTPKQTGEPVKIVINCDLNGELRFSVVKTWTDDPPEKIMSQSVVTIHFPLEREVNKDPAPFDVGDKLAIDRAERDLQENLWSALRAVTE